MSLSEQLLAAAGLALGGGSVTAVTGWLVQRRRAPLDVAALAQQIATKALEQASHEVDEAYSEAAGARREAAAARADAAATRVQMSAIRADAEELAARLRSLVQAIGAPDATLEGLRAMVGRVQ